MITSRNKVSRIGFAALLLAGVGMPALGQDTPESLLPPGFDDPAPTPAPAPGPAPAPTRAAAPVAPVEGVTLPLDNSLGNVAEGEVPQAATVDLSRYELPEFARHSLDRVGVLAAGNTAFPADSFGRSDGRWLQVLMRRMNAPIASRWASIVLRRALMSPLDTPANVNGADFAADRAWALLRMMASTISAQIRPYSIAVAALESRIRRRIDLVRARIMPASPPEDRRKLAKEN